MCDQKTSRMRRPWPALGRSATGREKKHFLNPPIFLIGLITQLKQLSFSGSFVIAIRPEVKQDFRTAAIISFYLLQKHFCIKTLLFYLTTVHAKWNRITFHQCRSNFTPSDVHHVIIHHYRKLRSTADGFPLRALHWRQVLWKSVQCFKPEVGWHAITFIMIT